jgi:hypothetical protein
MNCLRKMSYNGFTEQYKQDGLVIKTNTTHLTPYCVQHSDSLSQILDSFIVLPAVIQTHSQSDPHPRPLPTLLCLV